MGASGSLYPATAIIDVLTSESCPTIHPIWQKINADSFASYEVALGASEFRDLVEHKPGNFETLVNVTVKMFIKSADVTDKENVYDVRHRAMCNFFCTILSVSGGDADRLAWFVPPTTYEQAPITLLVLTLQRLLRLNETTSMLLEESLLDSRIAYLKTLLFVFYADCFGCSTYSNVSSPFVCAFDAFDATPLLRALFEIAPFVMLTSNSEKATKFLRAMMALTIPCMRFCRSWKLEKVDRRMVLRTMYIIGKMADSKGDGKTKNRITAFSEMLVALFNVVLELLPDIVSDISESEFCITIIDSLLMFYQRDDRLRVDVLGIISRLLQNSEARDYLKHHSMEITWCDAKLRKGTYADLFIVVLTDPLVEHDTIPVLQARLVSEVITKIATMSISLSFYSANRLFILLRKLWACFNLQPQEFEWTIDNVIFSIHTILDMNLAQNVPLIQFSIHSRPFLTSLKAKHSYWSFLTQCIIDFADAAEEPLNILDETERRKALQSLTSDQDAVVRPKSDIDMIELWSSVYRAFFASIFPDETGELKFQK